MLVSPQLELRHIKQDDNLSKLSLGKSEFTPLKIFLKKQALDFHQHDIAKTYVLVGEDPALKRVFGYITLMNSEILLKEHSHLIEISSTSKYEVFPALKIARLAIDKLIQGNGFGKMLLDWCITLAKDKIMPFVGCRFLVVDAKRESIAFYEKLGFILFDTRTNKLDSHPLMFFDLRKSIK